MAGTAVNLVLERSTLSNEDEFCVPVKILPVVYADHTLGKNKRTRDLYCPKSIVRGKIKVGDDAHKYFKPVRPFINTFMSHCMLLLFHKDKFSSDAKLAKELGIYHDNPPLYVYTLNHSSLAGDP
jgi:hypothetical protein